MMSKEVVEGKALHHQLRSLALVCWPKPRPPAQDLSEVKMAITPLKISSKSWTARKL
jgi:hypothetical protein